eukprot:CFRG3104T1
MVRFSLELGLLFLYSVNQVNGRVECEDILLDASDSTNYCSQITLGGGVLSRGTLCLLRPEQAHPTQLAVGKAAALCHRRQMEKMSSHVLKKYLRKNQVPVFSGPNDQMYISDKHHMSYALHQSNLNFKNNMLHRAMYACIQDDYSNMTETAFWKHMYDTGNAYPFDEFGRRVEGQKIPSGLKQLKDDPYRTLSRYVRTSHGYVKCGGKKTKHLDQCATDAPFFIEFLWANYLRDRLPVIEDPSKPVIRPISEHFVYETSFQSQVVVLRSALEQAVDLAMSDSAKDMPGWNASPEIWKKAIAEVDEVGCDNDTSE